MKYFNDSRDGVEHTVIKGETLCGIVVKHYLLRNYRMKSCRTCDECQVELDKIVNRYYSLSNTQNYVTDRKGRKVIYPQGE